MNILTKSSVALSAVALLLTASPAPVHAAESDWSELTEFWSEYGVSQAVQEELISGLEVGELFDAFDSTIEPVSLVQLPGGYKQIATFPDGSISVGSLEAEIDQNVSTLAIGGCSVSSGAGYAVYTNCTATEDNGIVYLSFKANYERFTGGARINKADTPVATVAYGSHTDPTVSIVRASASGAIPAVATAYTYYTGNGGGSETVYMSLRVTSASAFTTTY